jgi:hypothetical protein
MNITLEDVRQVLRETLGFHSFVAGFITRIQEDTSQPTAGITKDGLLAYTPISSKNTYPAGRPVQSDLPRNPASPVRPFPVPQRSGGDVAADAIINAAISTLYGKASRNGNLFRKTHAPHGLPGLLRPESEMANSRYEKLYLALYPRLYNTNASRPVS